MLRTELPGARSTQQYSQLVNVATEISTDLQLRDSAFDIKPACLIFATACELITTEKLDFSTGCSIVRAAMKEHAEINANLIGKQSENLNRIAMSVLSYANETLTDSVANILLQPNGEFARLKEKLGDHKTSNISIAVVDLVNPRFKIAKSIEFEQHCRNYIELSKSLSTTEAPGSQIGIVQYPLHDTKVVIIPSWVAQSYIKPRFMIDITDFTLLVEQSLRKALIDSCSTIAFGLGGQLGSFANDAYVAWLGSSKSSDAVWFFRDLAMLLPPNFSVTGLFAKCASAKDAPSVFWDQLSSQIGNKNTLAIARLITNANSRTLPHSIVYSKEIGNGILESVRDYIYSENGSVTVQIWNREAALRLLNTCPTIETLNRVRGTNTMPAALRDITKMAYGSS